MYIFVYGTLKRGQPNHYILESSENGKAKFICKGKAAERCPLIIATKYKVPFLLDHKGVGKQIQGDVYEIDDKMLETLDKLEQYPEIYSRRLELIICGEKEENELAWIYFFHTFNSSMLENEQFVDSYECKDPNRLPKYLGEKECSEILQALRG